MLKVVTTLLILVILSTQWRYLTWKYIKSTFYILFSVQYFIFSFQKRRTIS